MMKLTLNRFLKGLQILLFALNVVSLIIAIVYIGIYSSAGGSTNNLFLQIFQSVFCVLCSILYGVSVWASRPVIHWSIRLFFFFTGILGGWSFLFVYNILNIDYLDAPDCQFDATGYPLSPAEQRMISSRPTLCQLDQAVFTMAVLIFPCVIVELVLATKVKIRTKRQPLKDQVATLQRQLEEQQELSRKQNIGVHNQFQNPYLADGSQQIHAQLQVVQAQLYQLQQQQQQQLYANQAPVLLAPLDGHGRPLLQLPDGQLEQSQSQSGAGFQVK